MDANLWLWIGQVLLALAFLLVGYGHSLGFEAWSARPGMGWMVAVGRDRMRLIGGFELVGAIGLALPAAARVLPWLTPLAAACLPAVLALAMAVHLRRSGEGQNTITNLLLGVTAVLIAYGRFVVAPL